jgi:cathepsin X
MSTSYTTSTVTVVAVIAACLPSFAGAIQGYVPYPGVIEKVITSPLPHTLVTSDQLPAAFDWRNINGTNYCSRVLNQKNPHVCGSCWAEAATGALSDRYIIATGGLAQIQLSPQVLLNFNPSISGGTCNGGDHVKAYEFANKYGIADDSCAPFAGLNWLYGFEVAASTSLEEVQGRQCYTCDWAGACGFVPKEYYNLYGAEEFGEVVGVEDMMAEIHARGPIACLVNSESPQFNDYKGGIMRCEHGLKCKVTHTDHVIVITGWGIDRVTGVEYWVGRNSYGTQWGEGAGGGWFRMERGIDLFGLESGTCAWAVPAGGDVDRVLQQYEASL